MKQDVEEFYTKELQLILLLQKKFHNLKGIKSSFERILQKVQNEVLTLTTNDSCTK